jgi:hypothetical protein
MTTSTYPVKVKAQMDVRLNRSLWLVKWLLVIPELQELTVARRSPLAAVMHAKRGDRANIAIAGNSSGEYPNRNQFVCLASPKI